MSDKNLSSMMAIFSTIYFCGGDATISQHFEYLVFYNRDTSIELSLLWQSSFIWSLLVF